MPDLDARCGHVRAAMHEDFLRGDFIDRLVAHAGISGCEVPTQDQCAAFDAARRGSLEAAYDAMTVAERRAAARAMTRRGWARRVAGWLRCPTIKPGPRPVV